MFGNLFNVHDLFFIARKTFRGLGGGRLPVLAGTAKDRAKEAWKHVEAPPVSWWDIPAVRERWNLMISGDAAVDYHEYVSLKYLEGGRGLTALSLACGTGHRERRWAALGNFKRIDAYDLSEERIRHARESAEEEGLGGIVNYIVGDVYEIEMPEKSCDVVLAEQALHHFSPLEDILRRVEKSLRPGGLFVVNEFVGPTRFQWTERQLKAANALLKTLPSRYRRKWRDGTVKTRVVRPSLLGMFLRDPSEAVESSRILPLVRELFEVTEIREYGGTVISILLEGIAQNFLSGDSETRRVLRDIFDAEDRLLKSGDIKSDYVIAVCRRKGT
jgi:ubiquinone/menaquinone biosynthesis C-methylase UbiE